MLTNHVELPQTLVYVHTSVGRVAFTELEW